MFKKIPTTIVTGFLGAGKTSFIQNLIKNTDLHLALIINEFGTVGLDKDMIESCDDESCKTHQMFELANGCICCTVADDFLPAIENILALDKKPDHIIIETSGLALPKPLVKAFEWPSIRNHVTVDGVVTLLDAPRILKGIFEPEEHLTGETQHENPLEELFEDQLSLADIALLNKCDLISENDKQCIINDLQSNKIHGLRKGTPIIAIQNGKISPEIILGFHAALEDNHALRPSHHDGDITHDHDDFASFSAVIEGGSEGLNERILSLIEQFPIYRIKGFLAHKNKPMREVIQVAGPHIDRYFDRKWHEEEKQQSTVVIIGAKEILDHEKDIIELIEGCHK